MEMKTNYPQFFLRCQSQITATIFAAGYSSDDSWCVDVSANCTRPRGFVVKNMLDQGLSRREVWIFDADRKDLRPLIIYCESKYPFLVCDAGKDHVFIISASWINSQENIVVSQLEPGYP